jgi:hypothetical protein
LACTQMRRGMESAGEKVVVRFQASLPDPRLHRLAGRCRNFELHRSLGLLLQDDGAAGHTVAVTDVADAQLDQIRGAQFAVDAQVERRQFAAAVLHLQVNPDRPDLLRYEGDLLSNQLPLVPRDTGVSGVHAFHDELLVLSRVTRKRHTGCPRSKRGA